MTTRFAAVDVAYAQDEALAAAVLFTRWEQDEADLLYTSRIVGIAPYAPGQFYLRELPCILDVLRKLDSLPDLVIIDGYVWLNESSRPGLGAHLHSALRQVCAVVGVAKSCFFRGSNVAEVVRGRSRKPLFVTSVGVDLNQAAEGVRNMHGQFRIPTLLREADRISRSIRKP
jgi:deoxyribonuclease V